MKLASFASPELKARQLNNQLIYSVRKRQSISLSFWNRRQINISPWSEKTHNMKAIDLSGSVYGKLKAEILFGRKGRYLYWRCRCDCGNSTIVRTDHLTRGKITSCGCNVTKHGCHKSPEYRSWDSMKSRCYRQSYTGWHRYGGRGIKVCDRWLESFINFLEDMGKKPDPTYTIDRIDPDGNYEPSNCRWASKKEQRANQSVTRSIST